MKAVGGGAREGRSRRGKNKMEGENMSDYSADLEARSSRKLIGIGGGGWALVVGQSGSLRLLMMLIDVLLFCLRSLSTP